MSGRSDSIVRLASAWLFVSLFGLLAMWGWSFVVHRFPNIFYAHDGGTVARTARLCLYALSALALSATGMAIGVLICRCFLTAEEHSSLLKVPKDDI